MQVVARRDERRFEVLDGCVQRAELEACEAGPEETLRFQGLVFPRLFGQKSEGALERTKSTLEVSHGEAQPG
jgi:hypothetical protein